MEKKVSVGILGNKAWVIGISGRPADPPRWPEDRIQVWLEFEKPATFSFGVNLPVRSYTRDEFLTAVRREGEHRLKVMLGERELRKSKDQKLKELDKIAGELIVLIGLE